MADFINRKLAGMSWYPRPNERVEGISGKSVYQGIVLPSKKNPKRPAIFSKFGAVFCYVLTDLGRKRKVAVYELRTV